jgi:membrane-bound ClpP family serine protease
VIVYVAIALVGVLFLLASSLFDGVLDFLHLDADDGTSPLSGKVIAAALTAFGAAGMLATYADWPRTLAALTSGIVALLVGASVWWATGALYRQTASTDVTMASMRGRLAEVTIGIPAGSVGEVLLTAATSTRAMIARSSDGSAIAPGATVRIVETIGNTVIVEPASFGTRASQATAGVPETGGSDG